uniref:Putative secreted protein n=1 Tax=Anopheles triannulatus TaxID=58253 RepID=A0A2M4B0G6_9DIPT
MFRPNLLLLLSVFAVACYGQTRVSTIPRGRSRCLVVIGFAFQTIEREIVGRGRKGRVRVAYTARCFKVWPLRCNRRQAAITRDRRIMYRTGWTSL